MSTSHNTYNSLDKFSLLNVDQYFSNILKEYVLANQNTKVRCRPFQDIFFRTYENSDINFEIYQNNGTNDIIRLISYNTHATCDVVKKQGPHPLGFLADLHNL